MHRIVLLEMGFLRSNSNEDLLALSIGRQKLVVVSVGTSWFLDMASVTKDLILF